MRGQKGEGRRTYSYQNLLYIPDSRVEKWKFTSSHARRTTIKIKTIKSGVACLNYDVLAEFQLGKSGDNNSKFSVNTI